MAFLPRLWTKAPKSTSNLFAFEENGRTGFIDSTGRVVIPPVLPHNIYSVSDFVNGLAKAGSSGFIDTSGQIVRGAKQGPELDEEGLESFEAKGKPGIRQFFKKPMIYRDFPGLRGYRDAAGKILIPAVFADAGPFRSGLARVATDGYCHLATPAGYREGSPSSGYPSSCGGAPKDAVEPCPVGFIGLDGNFTIPAKFESARDFQEGLAAVRMGGKWGFIDISGAEVIATQFELAHSFHEGLAAVQVAGKWGYIDKFGAIRIDPVYADEVDDFSSNLALVGPPGRRQYIDRQGHTAVKGPFVEATPFVQGLAAVRRTTRPRVDYIKPDGHTVFNYTPRR